MKRQVFISYSGHDAFEASLLKYALETMLEPRKITAWTYKRDQSLSESNVASSLKRQIKKSIATIFLVSPSSFEGAATQWMELAYSDAFDVRTFVLLHHLDYQQLKTTQAKVPPLLLASQCNSAEDWRSVVKDLKRQLRGRKSHG